MSKSLKIILIVGGLVGLIVLLAVGLLLFVGANAYKPRLEAAASQVLGMEVRVGGRVGIGFFPGLSVTAEDVHIRNRGKELVSAQEAKLGIDLLPLFHKEVRIGKVALIHPRVSIERDRDGKYNFESPEAAGGTLPALALARVTVSDVTLLYADQRSGEDVEAGNCSVDVRRLRVLGGESQYLMKNLSFTAKIACGEVRTKDVAVSGLKFSVAAKGGVFDLKDITLSMFGGQGAGSIHADFSGAVPLYQVRYALAQFRIEEFLKILSPLKVAEGAMDFSADLSMTGKTVDEMKLTANGEASLVGKNIALHGHDLDAEFSRFESSQSFNLVDLGAFFFAGPVGLAVTKGYNFASIFQGSGGQSEIRTLVSDWKIEHGVAHARDVSMATNEHRIALQGGLDFVNGRFKDVTVALIDAKGCAKVQQKITGPFQKPVVEKPNILVSLAGPALKLLRKGRDLFPGGECKVFYAGSVAPPK